ncbi:MAG: hypothetical protein M1269_04930 [Chloroflexi bacterium]|nr:hypothetical protein [Chloroflexota bacterium]
MAPADYIQLGIGLILMVTFVAVLKQLKTVWKQLEIQNSLLATQALKDQWEMYWKTYEFISDAEIKEFEDFVGDYISEDLFKNKYAGNSQAIRRYIYYTKIYEYLAFFACQKIWVIKGLTYANESHGNIGSPVVKEEKMSRTLDAGWTAKWLADLINVQEFKDVHDYLSPYYPDVIRIINPQLELKKESE